jgi:hypothetical protein
VQDRLDAQRAHGRLVVAEIELGRITEVQASGQVMAGLSGDAAELLHRRFRVLFLEACDVDLGVVQIGRDLHLADRRPAHVEVADVGAEDLDQGVADVLADSGGASRLLHGSRSPQS